MNPEDILLWPDHFWCFREELDEKFLRDNNYEVLAHFSDEWLALSAAEQFCYSLAKG